MSLQATLIHNLPPQPTEFVGRKVEIADIINRLQDKNCRLLTLVGSGGVGKTRLAIESLQYLRESNFEHGIFYIPLAPLISAENIVTAIINTLGIFIDNGGTPQEELVKFLSQRKLLLVMDNFEHILDGVDLVTDILYSAMDVKILVTSRETLNLSMEYIWHVRGMHYPNSEEPEDINQYDALNLFVERALQIQHDFSPGDEQISIIQICQLVDGLPLAIELAAGWLKTLSCLDILKQIKRGIDFLATRNHDIPERHQSIRAVFDYSWNMLSSDEQAVFPRLSVFRGGFTLEAAEQVAEAKVITISGLVEKSMVRHDSTGRYNIHELIRQYGEEQLIHVHELKSVNDKHLDYFAGFMVRRTPDLQGRRQIDSLNEIRADFDNILVAWQYASQHLIVTRLDEMLECFIVFFEISGHPAIAKEVYASALEHFDESDATYERIRNRLKMFLRFSYFKLGSTPNINHIMGDLQASLDIAEQYEDQLTTWICLIMSGSDLQNPERDADMHRALKYSENMSPYYLGRTLDHISYDYTLIKNENSETARHYQSVFLEVTRALGDISGVATAYSRLGQHARFWGKLEDALYYYDKAIQGYRQTNNTRFLTIFKALRLFVMFKQGEFKHQIEFHPHTIEHLSSFGFFENHSFVYMIMAKSEAFLGSYDRSKIYLQHARSSPIDVRPRTGFHIIEAEIICAIGLGDFREARQFIIEALATDPKYIGARLLLDFFILITFLYHHDHQFVKAVELLGLVFTHPLATTGWMEKWKLLSQLQETLQQELGKHAYTVAWEQGAGLNINEVIAEIRAYVGLDPPAETLAQALVEPLTERELEVLALLGQGLSNREIAQELVVTVGTVKAHVYNICQKLAVKNRTQAVLEAKQIGLL